MRKVKHIDIQYKPVKFLFADALFRNHVVEDQLRHLIYSLKLISTNGDSCISFRFYCSSVSSFSTCSSELLLKTSTSVAKNKNERKRLAGQRSIPKRWNVNEDVSLALRFFRRVSLFIGVMVRTSAR